MISPPESFNDKRLDDISRPLFDECMRLALKMLDMPNCSSERLAALARFADGVATGFDEKSDKGEGARDDLCRRVFGRAALLGKAILGGEAAGGNEKVEALAMLLDAAACGFKDDDDGRDDESNAYDMTGGLL
jgi:hypothetical protein